MSTLSYRLSTGKANQLTLIATGKREYAIRAEDFSISSVGVGDVEI